MIPCFSLARARGARGVDTSGAAFGKAFVTLLDTTKSGANALSYSTFLGGNGRRHGLWDSGRQFGKRLCDGNDQLKQLPRYKYTGRLSSKSLQYHWQWVHREVESRSERDERPVVCDILLEEAATVHTPIKLSGLRWTPRTTPT